MPILILPGYSVKNKEWAYETKDKIDVTDEVIVFEWDHWTSGVYMDEEKEINRLKGQVDLNNDKSVSFIAKSVGIRILLLAIPIIYSKVNKVVLCGISSDPVYYKRGFESLNSSKTIIFQNSEDPFMSYDEAEKKVHLLNQKITIIEKIANTHHYPYYNDFHVFLTE